MFCIGYVSWLKPTSTNAQYGEGPKIFDSEIVDHIADVIDDDDIEYVGSGCGGENIYGGRGSGMGFRTKSGRGLGFSTSCHLSKRSAQGELTRIISDAKEVRWISNNNSISNILLQGGRFSLINTDEVDVVTFDGNTCLEHLHAPNLFLAEKLDLIVRNRDWK